MPGIYLSELSYEVDPTPILGSYPTWSLATAAICTKMRLEGSPMLRHPLPLIWASCLLHRPTVPPHKCSTGVWSNAALPLTSHLLLEKQPHPSEPQSSHPKCGHNYPGFMGTLVIIITSTGIFIEHFPCARPRPRYFNTMSLFNPPVREILLSSHFADWESEGWDGNIQNVPPPSLSHWPLCCSHPNYVLFSTQQSEGA